MLISCCRQRPILVETHCKEVYHNCYEAFLLVINSIFSPVTENIKLYIRSKHVCCSVGQYLCKVKKLAASSMLHEAKIAYYALGVIRFVVPYSLYEA